MKRLLCVLVLSLTSTLAHAFAPFELPWVNHEVRNTVYDSRDHPHAVFVLEFLSNACSACNQNAANVKALHSYYAHNDRVQVLDVAIDASNRDLAMWIARHRPAHPVLKDSDRRLWRQVGAQSIPTVVVTDCRGAVKFRHTGVWSAPARQDIHRVIDKLLTEDCP